MIVERAQMMPGRPSGFRWVLDLIEVERNTGTGG